MKSIKLLSVFFVSACLIYGILHLQFCYPATEPEVAIGIKPTVTTNAVESITNNSAVCGGNVTAYGSTAVSAKGVCWSTLSEPTISDSYTTDGSGLGSFTSNISGLDGNTPYFVRAYATNMEGTAYGNEISFTTTVTGTLPTVTTDIASSISDSSAICGGEVISEGSSAVIARGVCWSTILPTIADPHTSDGNGIGHFSSNLTGLEEYTPYYVRAYASNSEGTAYGNEIAFTTPGSGPTGEACPGIPSIIDPRDGQEYPTVKIGTQCWLRKNMNYLGGTSWCYDNSTSNCATYGRLYDWTSALGACPEGWHLPSNDEFGVLVSFLGSDAGGKMKEVGTEHWISPNTGATNLSGFTALGGGFRQPNGLLFYSLNARAAFWTSTETVPSSPLVWYAYLVNYESTFHKLNNEKAYGLSVRCLQD